MKKIIFSVGLSLLCFNNLFSADTYPDHKVTIVGSGMIGALEAYQAHLDAQKNGRKVRITIYEKGLPFGDPKSATTNTSYNIVPSLTPDEILSVVPRGSEMVNKLAILFSEPSGIRVDDVPGVNDSEAAQRFKEAVALYGNDENHEDRTQTLLRLGKMSMDLWQEMYDRADDELKDILEASYFNPCREPKGKGKRALHEGYRIDLIYGIPNAEKRAQGMQLTYEKLGYKNCKILSPDEVLAIDPSLADFCNDHSEANQWKYDSVALWRPGGCIDTRVFLPRFYDYLKKVMGTYTSQSGETKDCFRLKFNREIVALEYAEEPDCLSIVGLRFSDGSIKHNSHSYTDSRYIFCPGEAVGTLHKFGCEEPAYAGFAGPSLILNIPISAEQREQYRQFSHCMEVHKEGIVLAWQARLNGDEITIRVGGTKAFYGDQLPSIHESFAKNRHLVQLNMINHILPEFVSLALEDMTKGKELSEADLAVLENKGILERWVGRRSVAYDGFPTFGALYSNNQKISNARCTTHLGSGGISFAPAAVLVSRSSEQPTRCPFIDKVLRYADSRRSAQ